MSVRLHDPLAFRGRVEMHTIRSDVLRANALGDPHVRELPIYVPPVPRSAGDAAAPRDLPVIFILAGFTGRGQAYLETHPWRRGIVARFDAAVAAGRASPALLVLPDCFTRLGGSQYVNSSAVGAYEDHVVRELVPRVNRHPAARAGCLGVLGKSSGGFGALHLVLNHPGLFAAAASISGDCGFEAMFGAELLACARGLLAYDSDPARFLEAFFTQPTLDGDAHAVLNVLAMSACYSPNPDSALGFDLPLDLTTGERDPAVWRRWLAFDPLQRAREPAAAETLRALELLHLECGTQDEFHIQWGTRRLAATLRALDVPHVHTEHPGGHRGIDDRYGLILAEMAAALESPTAG